MNSPRADAVSSVAETSDETPGRKLKRNTRGGHALPIIRHLMKDSARWFVISSAEDYHYPGLFQYDYPQRMGYCQDITTMPAFETTDPDFLFTDIQLGKGKARGWRDLNMIIDGNEEYITYRVVPCGGVKLCPEDNCDHVVPTSEIRPCPVHKTPLVRTSNCPVEYVYVKPKDPCDHRRWLSGIDRCSDMKENFLHDHPLHADAKILAKVKADITRALVKNPHLTTRDIIVGKCTFVMNQVSSLRE